MIVMKPSRNADSSVAFGHMRDVRNHYYLESFSLVFLVVFAFLNMLWYKKLGTKACLYIVCLPKRTQYIDFYIFLLYIVYRKLTLPGERRTPKREKL